jgi:myo-inositol-1(or 4)-monophosphatase
MNAILEKKRAVPLSDATLTELTGFACHLADVARPQILPHFRVPIAVDNKQAEKGLYDPVTEADRGAEAAMRDLIRTHYPDHGIFGEEHGHESGSSGLTWVLDPLDGTRSFITGCLHWGVLIALYDGARPVLGVMDQPYTRERFVGNRMGAELRTERGRTTLRTRTCEDLADAVLYCTTPEMFTRPEDRAAFEDLASRVKLVRYGGDCYSYCMLAHGLVDLVVESSLAPYDVQALIPIVEGAGGTVSTWDGGSPNNGGSIIAAGSDALRHMAAALLSGASSP